jgi:hypothetical protein
MGMALDVAGRWPRLLPARSSVAGAMGQRAAGLAGRCTRRGTSGGLLAGPRPAALAEWRQARPAGANRQTGAGYPQASGRRRGGTAMPT